MDHRQKLFLLLVVMEVREVRMFAGLSFEVILIFGIQTAMMIATVLARCAALSVREQNQYQGAKGLGKYR